MKLVLFDFDGTLTTKDSFLEFIKHCNGRVNFLLGFFLLSPILVLYKIGLIKNWKAKEVVLTYFFKGQLDSKFESCCQEFALKKINEIINPQALNRLMERKNESFRIIIVSASAEYWIRPWSDRLGVELIGTQLEMIDNKLTGRISGKNCYGNEKVNRIKEIVDIGDYEVIEAYGDSSGDREMMKLATIKYYKTF